MAGDAGGFRDVGDFAFADEMLHDGLVVAQVFEIAIALGHRLREIDFADLADLDEFIPSDLGPAGFPSINFVE
jgi:hypothetical protein